MEKVKKVIVDDQMIDESAAYINMFDRGYHFGDGIYEVIRVWDGGLFAFDEHFNRFSKSATKIKIKIPYKKAYLKELIYKLIKENNVQLGTLFFQLTRGVAPRSHEFPPDFTKPVFTAFTTEKGIPEKEQNEGVAVIFTDDIRWLLCEIKSINLLPNVLAKQKAKSRGCFEAVFHRDGIVTEGTLSNVFIVQDGKVITHPESRLILNGITRQISIQLAEKNNIPIIQQEFSNDQMLSADEVFLTSTVWEIIPVVRVEEKVISKGIPGTITRQLQMLFREKIVSNIRSSK
jgi:D-alanine transaminase